MGGLAVRKSDESESGHSPPLPASSNSSSDLARGNFKSSSLKQKLGYPDLEDPPETHDNMEEKRGSRGNLCCAHASLLVGTFILILLLLGVTFFSFFGSNMPDFHLSSLTVNKLQFNTTGNDVFMDSDIEVALNATNDNNNIEFFYNYLRVDIFSGDAFLGRVHMPKLHQMAKNSTVLKAHILLKEQPVAVADSMKLQNDLQYHTLVINAVVKGFIHFKVNGNQITGFPFRVSCDNMVQYKIDQKQQSCKVRMTLVT